MREYAKVYSFLHPAAILSSALMLSVALLLPRM